MSFLMLILLCRQLLYNAFSKDAENSFMKMVNMVYFP